MTDDHGPVPDDVEHLVEFLNTLDVETGSDELDGFRFARSAPSDRQLARDLRAGLREAALANCEGVADRRSIDMGTRALRELPIEIRIAPDGLPLASRGTGTRRYLAGVAIEYLVAVQRGRFSRVKLCASPDCRWAFWDSSRNGSRRWCAMSGCGARSKMRAYRERLASR